MHEKRGEKMRINTELEQILLKVQKPARYTGGELNSVMKRKEEAAIRFAFCFPDTYEKGKIAPLPSTI